MKTHGEQNKLSVVQIFLRASVVFAVFFVLLFSVFVSAAKLPLIKKVVKPTVAAGSTYKMTVSQKFSSQIKYAEICRGTIKRTCKMVAKNIRGVKISVPIPANYPIGDAAIKITYKDENKKYVLVTNKAVKIVKPSSSGGGGGGGGGNGGGGGGDSSSSSSGATSLSNGDDFVYDYSESSSTPVPGNTPTPTPQTSTDSGDTKPVLVSH